MPSNLPSIALSSHLLSHPTQTEQIWEDCKLILLVMPELVALCNNFRVVMLEIQLMSCIGVLVWRTT